MKNVLITLSLLAALTAAHAQIDTTATTEQPKNDESKKTKITWDLGRNRNENRSTDTSNFYFTNGGNGAVLSFANVNRNGNSINSIPRFTMFFHIGTNANLDLGKNFGLFAGLNLLNIGMITEENNVKLKQRVYAVGVPVGIKVGNLNNFYVYAGAEAGFAINYKEKRFVDGKKVEKFNEWFSNRTNQFMPALFVGFQTRDGFGLKFQYYVNDFLNQNYTLNGAKPYSGIESKVFFVTLGYNFSRKNRTRNY